MTDGVISLATFQPGWARVTAFMARTFVAPALLAGLFLFPIAASHAGDDDGRGILTLAQQGLPQGNDVIGPLRRKANGELEVISPETATGASGEDCEKGALCVGPKQAYATLAAALAEARPKDIIDVIGGTYRESDGSTGRA